MGFNIFNARKKSKHFLVITATIHTISSRQNIDIHSTITSGFDTKLMSNDKKP